MIDSDKFSKELKLSQLMDGEWHELDRAECVASLCSDETLRSKWARYHIIRDAMKNEPVQADPLLVSRICSAIDDEPAYSNITPFGATGASARVGSVAATGSPATLDENNVTVDNTTEAQIPAMPVSQVQVQASGIDAARKPSWVNTGVAGFALAASVALVTVVGVNVFDQQATAPDVSTVASNASGSVVAPATTGVVTQPLTQTASVENVLQLPQAGEVQGDSAVLPVVDFVANTGSYWASPDSSMRVSDEERLNMMLSQHIEHSPTASREGLLPYSRLVGYRAIEQER